MGGGWRVLRSPMNSGGGSRKNSGGGGGAIEGGGGTKMSPSIGSLTDMVDSFDDWSSLTEPLNFVPLTAGVNRGTVGVGTANP